MFDCRLKWMRTWVNEVSKVSILAWNNFIFLLGFLAACFSMFLGVYFQRFYFRLLNHLNLNPSWHIRLINLLLLQIHRLLHFLPQINAHHQRYHPKYHKHPPDSQLVNHNVRSKCEKQTQTFQSQNYVLQVFHNLGTVKYAHRSQSQVKHNHMQIYQNPHAQTSRIHLHKWVFYVKHKTQRQYRHKHLLSLNENLLPSELIQQLATHHWSKQLPKSQKKHQNLWHVLIFVCNHVHHLASVKQNTIDAWKLVGGDDQNPNNESLSVRYFFFELEDLIILGGQDGIFTFY